jgi:hypothetical protein
MPAHGIVRTGVVGAVALMSCTIAVSAQMFVPTGRDTLRSLPGVEVIVEGTAPELERLGLTSASLRDVLERRLRAGAVTIYPGQKDNPSIAKPYLYLILDPLALPGGRLAVAIQLHLRQTLESKVTGSNVVNAMTWDAHTVVAFAPAEAPEVKTAILEMVDRFVSDWRAVH